MNIEGVIEHFKNAKVVECLSDGENYEIDYNTVERFNNGYKCKDINGLLVIISKGVKFSKIIEHKIEKLYTLKLEHKPIIIPSLRDARITVKQWNLPLTMLDEVKEVEVYDCYIGTEWSNPNKYVSYSFQFKATTHEAEGLTAHLEKATKEFFNTKK